MDAIEKAEAGVVATIGTFDGLHLGHQAILHRLCKAREAENLTALAVTFEPHPRVLVTPDSPPLLLSVWEEKVKLFSQYLSGKLAVLDFTRDMMNMSAEEFTRAFLVGRLNLKRLIVGYDHAFGKNRSGTINDLFSLSKKYSFELDIVEPVIVDGKPVSSSRIRRLIGENNLSRALEMLNHPYPVYGRVVKGIGLGKRLGFPTANLEISPRKLLPSHGVYACEVEVDAVRYRGMMFIGINHFNPGAGISAEANIFDFDGDLYGREIFCYPTEFIRENRKFDRVERLAEQIKLDKEHILKIKNRGVK
jgi:riboflavin kinase/FMN adenylyltransferase